MSEPAKEPAVMSRDFSTGTHASRLAWHEQKHHEQMCVSCGRVVVRALPLPEDHFDMLTEATWNEIFGAGLMGEFSRNV
jgi:hypothetical protein